MRLQVYLTALACHLRAQQCLCPSCLPRHRYRTHRTPRCPSIAYHLAFPLSGLTFQILPLQRCSGGTRNWYRRRASDAHWDDNQRPQRSVSNTRASPFANAFRVSMMNEPSPMSIADSTAEQSIESNNMTDTSTYSSLLDGGRIGSKLGPYLRKSSTIRTVTTEAKSFVPSEWPSTTRTEGNAMAAFMLGCDDGPGEAFGRSRSSCEHQCQFER